MAQTKTRQKFESNAKKNNSKTSNILKDISNLTHKLKTENKCKNRKKGLATVQPL